ncbi:Fc receptor-like protein 5, partial [Silurus meridionalis]
EKPQPELTSDLKGDDVLTGNSVTLYCTLKPQSAGWKFYWRKDSQWPETETETRTETHYHTIRSVSVSDGGQYRCRAGRGNPVYSTPYSYALSVNVIESPKPVVIIKPDTQVFRGETVTFRCEIQSEKDTEWTYDWYMNDYTHYTYYTEQELSISPVTESYRGKYTCRGRRHSDNQISEMSDSVTLTVSGESRPKPVVKIDPAVNVFIGETVTLTCDIQTGRSWKYHWYRNNEEIRAAAGEKTYKITDVKDSNKGPYSCKGTQSSDPKYTQSSDAVTLTVSG